ncbi:MAG: ABC transporter substrate-binding protein [Nakamurella sp.]
MRSPTKAKALIAIAIAAALALAACSDPSNPAPATSSPAPQSSAAGASSPGTSSSGTGAESAASVSQAMTGGGSGSSSAPNASGSSPTPTGESGDGGGTPAQPGQAAAKASGTLNIFMYQKTSGVFNPLAPASGPDEEVISLMYQGLMTTDPRSGQLVPQLVSAAPTISDGAKTFTFKLKPNLKWSDGQPLTSKDVLFTYTRAADPAMENGPGQGDNFKTVVGLADFVSGKSKTISGFSTPDDSTFVIKLTQPNVGFIGQVGLYGILPEHAVGTLTVKTFASDPYFVQPKVGNGPFVVSEFKTDQYAHLTANPNFRYQVGVKDVFVKLVTSDVATQQLQTGEMDIANVAPVDMATVQSFPGFTVTPVDATGFVRAAWNQSQARFKDPRVLQAFLYGMDRKALVAGALKGQGTVQNSVFGTPWQAPGLNQYPYNPDKAKQLLKAANWDSSKPVVLSWIAGGNPDRDAAAQIMQNQLKSVGINIKLNQVQGAWFTTNVPKANFDMTMYGGGDYTSNPANVIPITSCQKPGGGANNGLYCNQKFQQLVEKANVTEDATARKALYQQASTIENADPSQMWLYSQKVDWAVSGKVKNFVGGSLGAPWGDAGKGTKAP